MFNLFCGCRSFCQPNPCRCHNNCKENMRPHCGCQNSCEERNSWHNDWNNGNNWDFRNNNSWQQGGCNRFEPIFFDNRRPSFGNDCQGLVIINPTTTPEV